MYKKENNTKLSRVKKRNQIKSKWKKGLLLAVIILVMTISAFTGYASWKLDNIMNKASKANVDLKPSEEEKKETTIADEAFGVVVLGKDYRTETGSMNTDAIIVSVFNPKTLEVKLLSIPRDLKVNLTEYGNTKVNSIYAKGETERRSQESRGINPTIDGPTLIMDTLSAHLDIPIKHYIVLDFKGFEEIVDELGGINIDVERDMVYHSVADGTNINLKMGLQTLDGKEALDYARFRKSSDGNDSSDFERNERHQKIIKSLVDEVATFKGISNIFDVLDIAGEHISTNFTPQEMKALFWKYKSIAKENITSIKMESTWKNPYVIVEDQELNRVKVELQSAFN